MRTRSFVSLNQNALVFNCRVNFTKHFSYAVTNANENSNFCRIPAFLHASNMNRDRTHCTFNISFYGIAVFRRREKNRLTSSQAAENGVSPRKIGTNRFVARPSLICTSKSREGSEVYPEGTRDAKGNSSRLQGRGRMPRLWRRGKSPGAIASYRQTGKTLLL